ncbi:MAG: T9SS type A sorting domain-containing protein [Saprospiraceae bacterium]|nr:T9SS type A sorting domain-containing protein [Saprospiraceae bacterium]
MYYGTEDCFLEVKSIIYLRGNYEGVAIDANDCTLVISTIVISSESDIKMEAEIVNERDNMQNGKICLNVLGGKAPYTYKWSNSGLSQRCLENLTAGTYQVTVTDANECNIYTSFIVESVVESKEQVSTPVQIFPNPASENVLITAETDITSVDILQTDGLSVISMKNIHGSKTIIDLMPLSAGNYFIKVKTQTITKYFRLIKI